MAGVDILTQRRYTILIKTVGASILTFVFLCANSAQRTLLLTIGRLNEIDARIPLAIAMLFGVAMFFFAAFNYMGDEPSEVYCGIDWELLRRHARPMVLAVVQLACAVGLMVMTLWPEWKTVLGKYFRLYFVIFFSVVTISTSFWAMSRILAKIGTGAAASEFWKAGIQKCDLDFKNPNSDDSMKKS